jgi:hypothetical protein
MTQGSILQITETGEDSCVLCPRDTAKDGAFTEGERMGEVFLCWQHVKTVSKLGPIEREEPEEEHVALGGHNGDSQPDFPREA